MLIVRPKLAYRLVNFPTGSELDPNKNYEAIWATNQPNWKEKGLIFVEDILLETGEYDIILVDETHNKIKSENNPQ